MTLAPQYPSLETLSKEELLETLVAVTSSLQSIKDEGSTRLYPQDRKALNKAAALILKAEKPA